jgi:hypothetical protein
MMKTKTAQARGCAMQPEDFDKQWQQLETRAAKLGLSLEEFLARRLMDLQEKQPEAYAELEQQLATSSLRAVRTIRQASGKLAQLESTAQKDNATALLAAVRDMRDNLDAMLDCTATLALATDGSQTPS